MTGKREFPEPGPESAPAGSNPPLMESPVAAGFPSPAEQYAEMPLDLNELLVRNPPATYFVRASGDSMTGAGIRSGDILVVDRSLDAADGSIVIANVDGEFTVKRLRMNGHSRAAGLYDDGTRYDTSLAPYITGPGVLRVLEGYGPGLRLMIR